MHNVIVDLMYITSAMKVAKFVQGLIGEKALKVLFILLKSLEHVIH